MKQVNQDPIPESTVGEKKKESREIAGEKFAMATGGERRGTSDSRVCENREEMAQSKMLFPVCGVARGRTDKRTGCFIAHPCCCCCILLGCFISARVSWEFLFESERKFFIKRLFFRSGWIARTPALQPGKVFYFFTRSFFYDYFRKVAWWNYFTTGEALIYTTGGEVLWSHPQTHV